MAETPDPEFVRHRVKKIYRLISTSRVGVWSTFDNLQRLKEALKFPYFFPEFETFFRPTVTDLSYPSLYTGLLPGNTRVLEILPMLDDEEVVRCRLVAVNIDKFRKYNALSYTWGDPHEKEAILVNGDPMSATKNAATILRHLSSRKELRAQSIWIDSICINQSDPADKGKQVSMIPKIFRNAADVIVSLGEAFAGDGLGVSFTRRLATLLNSSYAQADMNDRKSKIFDFVRSVHDQHEWSAFLGLFNHTWWSRAWVAQEMILASSGFLWSARIHLTLAR